MAVNPPLYVCLISHAEQGAVDYVASCLGWTFESREGSNAWIIQLPKGCELPKGADLSVELVWVGGPTQDDGGYETIKVEVSWP